MRFENLIIFVISIVILFYLKNLFLIIFAAIILVNIFNNLINLIDKIYILPRTLSLLLSILIVFTMIASSIILIAPPFIKEFQEILSELPSAASQIIILLNDLINKTNDYIYGSESNKLFYGISNLDNFISFPDDGSILNGIKESLARIIDIASNIGSLLIQIIFIFIIAIMISLQPSLYKEAYIKLIPKNYRSLHRRIIKNSNKAISNWLICVLISSFFIGLLSLIGLTLLGVKHSVANAFIAVIFNVIPNIGPFVSTIFPMSIALLDNAWKSLGVILLYILIQNVETYFITPSIMQRQTRLLPGITLLGQFALTFLFGPLGLILSLPIIVVIQVIIKEISIQKKLNYSV